MRNAFGNAVGIPGAARRLFRGLFLAHLKYILRANHLLLAAVERVIGPHHYAGPQKNDIYILCDLELVALKLFAAPEVLTAALEIGVKPGATFTEESCGTNALALAREHKRLVAVRGEQHYCRLFKDWWCVAAPVKGPAGNILGYLDISLHALHFGWISLKGDRQAAGIVLSNRFILLPKLVCRSPRVANAGVF
jgi:hypothetical protein